MVKRDGGSDARLGRLATPHGIVETPAFIFCATKASIKALAPDQAAAAGTQIILGNTYHLMLRPGAELVERMGGTAPVHGLGAADAQRFRRLPGV